MTRTITRDAKRWVIKIGSALLTNDGAGLDRQAIDGWVEQIAQLLAKGNEVVLVSSGAIAEGIAWPSAARSSSWGPGGEKHESVLF